MSKDYAQGDLFVIQGVTHRFIESLDTVTLGGSVAIMEETKGTVWFFPAKWLPLLDDGVRNS